MKTVRDGDESFPRAASAAPRDAVEVFDRIFPAYDRMNRILSLCLDPFWRRRAARRIAAECRAAPRILDLASGTGDFAIALSRAIADASIVCADPSVPMLAAAKRKIAARQRADRFSFLECRAGAIPCADASFNAVSCAFGFRNFPSADDALRECARVLEPGGVLGVLEFTRPRTVLFRAALSGWLATASLFAGRLRRDYAHLRRSINATFTAGEFVERAASRGFRAVRAELFLPACRFFLFRRA